MELLTYEGNVTVYNWMFNVCAIVGFKYLGSRWTSVQIRIDTYHNGLEISSFAIQRKMDQAVKEGNSDWYDGLI